nr:hypothetical protein [Erythrotrichia longistipitata]
MIKAFFPLSISHFLLVRHKTKKIVYTEISYLIKLSGSIILIAIYRPMNIGLILFFIIFLFLIYQKLNSTNYIAYKRVSGNILILKFIVLISILILGKDKIIANGKYNTLSTLDLNVLVDLNKNDIFYRQDKLKFLFNHIGYNCLKSIYKVEIASLISIIASQLLMISIQPKNLLYFFNLSRASISTKSELNLIFTFSSQIYFLITDQITKMITALKIRASNNTVENLLHQNKIIEFLFLYMIKKKYNLKQEVMTSAQLNSNDTFRSYYSNLNNRKILLYSNKLLITFIALITCFLLFI